MTLSERENKSNQYRDDLRGVLLSRAYSEKYLKAQKSLTEQLGTKPERPGSDRRDFPIFRNVERTTLENSSLLAPDSKDSVNIQVLQDQMLKLDAFVYVSWRHYENLNLSILPTTDVFEAMAYEGISTLALDNGLTTLGVIDVWRQIEALQKFRMFFISGDTLGGQFLGECNDRQGVEELLQLFQLPVDWPNHELHGGWNLKDGGSFWFCYNLS